MRCGCNSRKPQFYSRIKIRIPRDAAALAENLLIYFYQRTNGAQPLSFPTPKGMQTEEWGPPMHPYPKTKH